jgi:hypothetical protein
MRMRKLLVVVAATCALVAVPTAVGHGQWFDTRTNTERALVRKFPPVTTARCFLVPQAFRARYGVRSQTQGGVRRWNHFWCGVHTTFDNVICFVVVHHTGRQWFQMTVTSWPVRGCSPRELAGG